MIYKHAVFWQLYHVIVPWVLIIPRSGWKMTVQCTGHLRMTDQWVEL